MREIEWNNLHPGLEEAMSLINFGSNKDTFSDRNAEDLKELSILNITTKDVVLDFGCGIGRLCKALGSSCKEVIGVDVCADFLLKGYEYCRNQTNVRFVLSTDKIIVPIESNTINKMFSCFTIQHIDKNMSFFLFKEFYRMLVDGGEAVIHVPRITELFSYTIDRYIIESETASLLFEYYTEEEIRKKLSYVGFKILSVNIKTIRNAEEEIWIHVKK